MERASHEELERKLLEARAEAAAFEATAGELREELSSRGDADVLEEQLTTVREEMARLEQVADKRKAKANELAQELEGCPGRTPPASRSSSPSTSRLLHARPSRAKHSRPRPRSCGASCPRLASSNRSWRPPARRWPATTGLRAAEGEGEGAPGAGRGRAARSAAATADLEQGLRSAQEEGSRLEQLVAERRAGSCPRGERARAARGRGSGAARRAPKASELEQELATAREEMARLEQARRAAEGEGEGARGAARGRAGTSRRRDG